MHTSIPFYQDQCSYWTCDSFQMPRGFPKTSEGKRASAKGSEGKENQGWNETKGIWDIITYKFLQMLLRFKFHNI